MSEAKAQLKLIQEAIAALADLEAREMIDPVPCAMRDLREKEAHLKFVIEIAEMYPDADK
jgi:hypothetical protein